MTTRYLGPADAMGGKHSIARDSFQGEHRQRCLSKRGKAGARRRRARKAFKKHARNVLDGGTTARGSQRMIAIASGRGR